MSLPLVSLIISNFFRMENKMKYEFIKIDLDTYKLVYTNKKKKKYLLSSKEQLKWLKNCKE